jgi:hypothetical protein
MLSIFLGVIAGASTLLICLNAGTIGNRLRIMDRPTTTVSGTPKTRLWWAGSRSFCLCSCGSPAPL